MVRRQAASGEGMNKFLQGKPALLVARILLALVFLTAGFAKLYSPVDFSDVLASYRILPLALISFVAVSLPLFEILCGLAVLTGFYGRAGALGMVLMLAVFLLAAFSAMLRGLSVNCGCFGDMSWLESNTRLALLRDFTLFFLSAFLYWRFSQK
jgi:putative oxidoreductase